MEFVRYTRFGAILIITALLSGCAPEVGSEAWCEDMIDTPKGDWSVNEAAEFAQNCVFKTYNGTN